MPKRIAPLVWNVLVLETDRRPVSRGDAMRLISHIGWIIVVIIIIVIIIVITTIFKYASHRIYIWQPCWILLLSCVVIIHLNGFVGADRNVASPQIRFDVEIRSRCDEWMEPLSIRHGLVFFPSFFYGCLFWWHRRHWESLTSKAFSKRCCDHSQRNL